MRHNPLVFTLLLVVVTVSLGVIFNIIALTSSINRKVTYSGQVLQGEATATPTPYCTEPAGGCGENYYWDSGSCVCKSSTSTCYPPPSGCPSNYYWDYNLCSCQYYTSPTPSCSPPSSGCGTGYYWDSGSCSCRTETTTSTCNPPSSGCSTDYYWDSYSCSCKPSTTSCTPPSSGCGTNDYFDYYSCSCKSYDANYQQTNFDRLAYESEERRACVKSILTSYEYDRLRFYIPQTSSEQEEIARLGEKAKSCWGGYAGQVETGVAVSPGVFKTPVEYESCLVQRLGEVNYREIYTGVRRPTYEEHLKYEACFGQKPKSSLAYYTSDFSLPKEVDGCLRDVLKEGGLYNKVKGGLNDVPYELREKVNRCFGINPQPFEEGRVYQIPSSVKSCLIESVGGARFSLISSGQSEPTQKEKEKGQACFEKLNADQLKFLPPPPEQVPFLETDFEIVRLASARQEAKGIKDDASGGKVIFSGKGPPASVVYIYIFTEPVVVTTKTDENGDWIYELEEPLKGENHVAYAVVKASNGRVVKSSVFDFTVVASEEDLQKLESESQLSVTTRNTFIYRSLLLVGGAALLVILGYAGYTFRKMNKHIAGKDGVDKDTSSGV